MASPASSDHAGRSGGGLAGLPAPEPKAVQYLGTSWVERGPAYWTRRVLLFIGRCFIVLLMAVLAGSAFYEVASAHLSAGARTAAFLGMGVLVLVGFGFGVRETVLGNRSTLTPEERRAQREEMTSRQPWPIRLLRMRIVLLLLLPVTGPALFGFVLAWLPGVSLGRELPEERQARAQLTETQERYDALVRKIRG